MENVLQNIPFAPLAPPLKLQAARGRFAQELTLKGEYCIKLILLNIIVRVLK